MVVTSFTCISAYLWIPYLGSVSIFGWDVTGSNFGPNNVNETVKKIAIITEHIDNGTRAVWTTTTNSPNSNLSARSSKAWTATTRPYNRQFSTQRGPLTWRDHACLPIRTRLSMDRSFRLFRLAILFERRNSKPAHRKRNPALRLWWKIRQHKICIRWLKSDRSIRCIARWMDENVSRHRHTYVRA